ncbi:MAG TPA: toast rack family protein [Terriglobia bacterium]|nr:toast rack family protein [Terriglobia bacterium]
MNTRPRVRGLAIALVVVACGFACTINDNVTTGDLRTETQSVDLGGAKSVRVEIKMGAGKLKVGSGVKAANGLLDAEFTYNVRRWKPEVHYARNGDQGQLTIEQPGDGGSHGNTRYDWDLRLANKVPTEMSVNIGAGKADLILGGLALTNLDVNLGAGETNVDLTGDWKNDFSGHIKGGVGKATIRLPRDVGVRVEARGGLGSIDAHDFRRDGDYYVNDAYGKSPVTLHVDVEGGVGQIVLELGEAPPVV